MSQAQEFQITKPNLRAFNQEAERTLQGLAAKYNLTVKLQKSAYGDTYFESRFQFAKDCGGKEAEAFRLLAPSYGLKPEDLGAEVELQVTRTTRDRFRITGVSTGRSKFPIIANRVSDGKVLQFTAAAVVAALGRGK